MPFGGLASNISQSATSRYLSAQAISALSAIEITFMISTPVRAFTSEIRSGGSLP